MEYSAITLNSTVYAINRPPNNNEDMVEGIVYAKSESAMGQEVVVRVVNPGSVMHYVVLPADVYDNKTDCINALEDIYEADAATKAAYVSTLRDGY